MNNRNVIGIIAEYNPFHRGHRYQIETAAAAASADAAVVVMSGNFVQRGSFACADKWTRAEMALRNGADLIIEIPVARCLGDASSYASAGVGLLEATGIVTHLAFGSESGDLETLQAAADHLNAEAPDLQEMIRAFQAAGRSYPAARAAALEACCGIPAEVLSRPNDILAVEYLRAVRTLSPVPVRRVGPGYHETGIGKEALMSSSGVRQALREGRDISAAIPENIRWQKIPFLLDESRFADLIRYRILTAGIREIMDCPAGEEGLAHLLKEAARTEDTPEGLILAVKSRRYTYTRISRLLYQLLLGITREQAAEPPEYLRILGFTEKGRELLRDMTDGAATLPVITNVNRTKVVSRQLETEFRATDLYNLGCGRDLCAYADQRHRVLLPEEKNSSERG